MKLNRFVYLVMGAVLVAVTGSTYATTSTPNNRTLSINDVTPNQVAEHGYLNAGTNLASGRPCFIDSQAYARTPLNRDGWWLQNQVRSANAQPDTLGAAGNAHHAEAENRWELTEPNLQLAYASPIAPDAVNVAAVDHAQGFSGLLSLGGNKIRLALIQDEVRETIQAAGGKSVSSFDAFESYTLISEKELEKAAFSESAVAFDNYEVPEPQTLVLMGFGMVGMGTVVYRRRQGRRLIAGQAATPVCGMSLAA